MEQLQITTFRQAMFQSCNAEEALLVALNICAQTIAQNSVIQQPDLTTFGTWLMRIEGQRHGMGRLARRSLSFLTLPRVYLFSNELVGATLVSSDLEGARGNFLCAALADLSSANFKGAYLTGARFFESNLSNTNFAGATLNNADMNMANLTAADLSEASLAETDLTFAELTGANLTKANLTGANLTDAVLTDANLTGADLTGANLTGADLTGANLTGADLTGANLTGANLERTNLNDVEMDERVAEQIRDFKAKQTRP
jgi:uncharacterized protein YjbI with pentapeptide repeats